MRMRSRVILPGVRLDFHDASGTTIRGDQQLVEQGGRERQRGALVKLVRQNSSGIDIDTPLMDASQTLAKVREIETYNACCES